MKWLVQLAALFICSSACYSQSDQPGPPLSLFSVPSVTLPEKKPPRVLPPLLAEISQQTSSEREPVLEGLLRIRQMNGEDLFAPAQQNGPSNTKFDLFGEIFALDDVKIGKVHMAGGIVTAIKRRNPVHL